MSSNNDEIKQIQFSTDLLKIKKKRNTRKKAPAVKLSAGTTNTIKNNLIQRIQSHKMDEMGGIEKIQSNSLHKQTLNHNAQLSTPTPTLPQTNHLTEAMSYLSNIKTNPNQRTTSLNRTIKQAPNPNVGLNPNIGSSSDAKDPPYGVLKGGSKPLYRNWVNQTLKHPQNPTTYTNNLDEDMSQPSVLKVVRKRKMTLGKTKMGVGVLVKNAKTRKDIARAKSEIQNAKIHDIKHDLFKKGMIRTGSVAPDDVLKNMYESSILAGHITNETNIYKNALNNIENKLNIEYS